MLFIFLIYKVDISQSKYKRLKQILLLRVIGIQATQMCSFDIHLRFRLPGSNS